MKRNHVITAIAILVSFCLFIATNSAASLAIALTAVLLPCSSLAAGALIASRVGVSFRLKESVVVGQDMVVCVSVMRPAVFRGRIELTLERRNVLVGTVEELHVSLAPARGKTERFELPLSANCCGRVQIALKSARVGDALGFGTFSLPHASLDSSYTVYPAIVDIDVQTARANRASLSGATYDQNRRGQDATEVFEMRDYRDGDSLKAVHWKLSARFDELIVREASRPTDYDVVLLVDVHAIDAFDKEAAKVLDAAFSVASSISLALVRLGLGHMVALTNGEETLRTSLVDGRAGFDEGLDSAMSTPLSRELMVDTLPFEVYRRAYNVTKTVLVTDRLDEALFAGLSALCDLSVFLVSDQGYSALDDAGAYLLTYLSSDAIGDRVKSLEL